MKKIIIHISTLLLFVMIASSCTEKKEVTNKEDPTDNIAEMLAGTSSKTWHMAKHKDASGDKEKVTTEEKDETLNLYKDGKFSITDAQGTATGTWSTEGSHTLVMHFEGKDVTESFSIMDLSKEKAVLQAADGSEIVLKEN